MTTVAETMIGKFVQVIQQPNDEGLQVRGWVTGADQYGRLLIETTTGSTIAVAPSQVTAG